jgi:hypothetical protein
MNKKPVSEKKTHIRFSMNVPDWFKNIPTVEEKCEIVEDLAAELKDEPSISQEQRKELFTIK